MKSPIALFALVALALHFQGCDRSSSVSLPFARGKSSLKGEVFLVAGGGQSLRLGDVAIHVQTLDSMNQWLASANQRASKLQSTLREKQEILRKILAGLSDLEPKVDKTMAAIRRLDSEEQKRVMPSLKEFLDESNKLKYNRDVLNQDIKAITADILRLYSFDTIPDSAATTRTGADGSFEVTVEPDKVYVVAAEARRETSEKGEEKYFWMARVEAKSGEVKVALSNSNRLPGEAFFTRVAVRP